MKLVLTNDDGIEAPGLLALEQACRRWTDITVVAPDACNSSMSHHVHTDKPILASAVAEGRFRVEGSPADCARLAWAHFAPNSDWLIAGINRGGNLGTDTYYSGTVAAAREAALLGWRAIAISHLIVRGREVDWNLAAVRAEKVFLRLFDMPLAPGEFWNVNLPHPTQDEAEPELVLCPLDLSPLPVSFKREGNSFRYNGQYPLRERLPGTDVDLCFGGRITVSRLGPAF